MTTATRPPFEPVAIGADIGNATTTVATADGRLAFFPSFYATTRRAYEGMPKISTSRHHVTYNGTHRVIGADALEMPGHDSLMSESLPEHEAYRRYLEDASLSAFLAGISALYPSSDVLGIKLATGAPLSVYEPWGATIRDKYLGAHSFSYLGHPRKVVVTAASVLGEGAEALRLLPAEERSGKVAVHDHGGRTYNVLFFKDGALVKKKSYDAGIDRLFADIPSVSSDPGARWALQCEMRSNPKSHAAIRAELNERIVETLATIERTLRLGDADRHVLMGGGALHSQGAIRARYGKPVVLLNKAAPEAANALAYAKAAEAL